VADGLLARTGDVDGLQREGDFDEFFSGFHEVDLVGWRLEQGR
jgi:hypothetical protein